MLPSFYFGFGTGVALLSVWSAASAIILRQSGFNDPYGSQDCCALQLEGKRESGVYIIYPYDYNTSLGIQVFCDLETNGGGWTVLQRREEVTGPVQRFYQGWDSYVAGFGSVKYSHWLGLDKIAAITSGMDQELRIEFTDWKNAMKYSAYREFHVDGKLSDYRLSIWHYYNGTAGDSFSVYSNGASFTTKDRHNDREARNCAVARRSAWWYISCDGPNLNGLYQMKGMKNADGISWVQFKGYRYGLKGVEMKVRNRNYPNGCIAENPLEEMESDSDA